MKLIVMSIEHQLPHMHSAQKAAQSPYTECLVCVHRNTIVMDHRAESEAYNAAAGIQHMYSMRLKCDKATIPVALLQVHAKMMKHFWSDILSLICQDASEYLYFVDNNALLAQQLLDAFKMPYKDHTMCAQVLFGKIRTELDREKSDPVGLAETQSICTIYDNEQSDIERSDIQAVCFQQYMHRWLCEYSAKEVVCQFFGMNPRITYGYNNSANTSSAFDERYNVVRDAFSIYRRIVDINLLTAAPYGTVTMGIKTFCSTIFNEDAMLICLAHSMPSAHRQATYTPYKMTACVSVAKAESLCEQRKELLSNYAIYLPFDIDAAIYLRFGVSRIADILLARIHILEKAVIEVSAETCEYKNMRMFVFFDRGVFCANVAYAKLQESETIEQLRLELIDIYRNVHWMGLNFFYKDASLVFPRITARLSSRKDHAIKLLSTKRSVLVSDILFNLQTVLQNALKYIEKLKGLRSELQQICIANIQAAIGGDFMMAHESIRLALGMTHRSVHKYAEYAQKDAFRVNVKYVRMALMCHGKIECEYCQYLYNTTLYKDNYTTEENTLQQAYTAQLTKLQRLKDCECSLQYNVALESIGNLTTQDKIKRSMFALSKLLKQNMDKYEIHKKTLSDAFQRHNRGILERPKMSHIYSRSVAHSANILLGAATEAQMATVTGGISYRRARRSSADIRKALNDILLVRIGDQWFEKQGVISSTHQLVSEVSMSRRAIHVQHARVNYEHGTLRKRVHETHNDYRERSKKPRKG